MTNFVITAIEPAGGGAVTRTENIVDRTEHYDYYDYYNEFRYHWNCDTLQAIPANGYVFDHWRVSVVKKWYDMISDPSGKSPFSWEEGPYWKGDFTDNPLKITIKDDKLYPDVFDSDSPGYTDVDIYIGSTQLQPEYLRPWIENYMTFTAVFKKVSPTYTHLPVYSITQNKLIYHTTPNKLLRDSP